MASDSLVLVSLVVLPAARLALDSPLLAVEVDESWEPLATIVVVRSELMWHWMPFPTPDPSLSPLPMMVSWALLDVGSDFISQDHGNLFDPNSLLLNFGQ